MTSEKVAASAHSHSHMWVVGVLSIAAGLVLMVYVPSLTAVSQGIVLFAGFHLVGAVVLLASIYVTGGEPLAQRLASLAGKKESETFDFGCGAGRTTIAVGRAFEKARIVAFDRFDSDYIEGGGRHLLEHNVRLAGIDARVRVERGDLTSMLFPAEHYDAVVSAHAVDQLGAATEQGRREILRVLKPGERFLLVVWVLACVKRQLAVNVLPALAVFLLVAVVATTGLAVAQ